MSAADRVKSYPNEYLTLNYNKKIFCSACREPLALKKCLIDYHITSQKDLKGKENIISREKREFDIAESLKQYDTAYLRKLEFIDRVKVVTTMLQSINLFCDLLEQYGLSLTSASNLIDLLHSIFKINCIA